MKANEPMSDDMLTDDEREIITEEYIRSVKRELAEALAEIDRLRIREQALEAENQRLSRRELVKSRDRWLSVAQQRQAQIDAMRPVVEAVATHNTTYSIPGPAGMGNDDWCVFHEGCCYQDGGFTHDADCPVTRARAFVAAHPATPAEDGEEDTPC